MAKVDENLIDTLSYYNIDYNTPFFISSGAPIIKVPDKAFRFDFYAFCICTAGSIEMIIDNTCHCIKSNDFIITAPSSVIRFGKRSKDFKMRLLFFEENFILRNIINPFIIEKLSLFRNGYYTVLSADRNTISHFIRILDFLKKKSSGKGYYSNEIVQTIIFNLLFEVAEYIRMHVDDPKENISSASHIYLRFRRLVQEDIAEDRSVSYYADKLNISNKYLIEIVNKVGGKTPHEIIDEVLLKEAYIMLGNTEMSIDEIADRLHFNSHSAFSRFFKKQVGISPSDYRKKER